MRRHVLIAGPTASGKSALALAVAEAFGGTIVNADALQVYDGWRILTARPGDDDLARAPHALYGHAPPEQTYSTGRWLRDLAPLLKGRDRLIITGGTGLYFRALTQGLAEIPETPPEVRTTLTARLRAAGVAALAAELRLRDPETAARIDLANPMRVQRALEVLEATGKGLTAWRADQGPPPLPLSRTIPIVLRPDRDWLYDRCDRRFDLMLDAGALEEVRAMAARIPAPAATAMNALGARQLLQVLAGAGTLEDAATEAKTATRNYAKRQSTWFRNQMAGWTALDPAAPDCVARAMALTEETP